MPHDRLSSEMVHAVVAGDICRVMALLDTGIDIDATNEHGETAFSFACANNALGVAKALYRRGAEINTLDAGGGSPLDWAVCWASPEFRNWLISVGGERRDNSYEPWPWPPKSEGACPGTA
ncbi:ankyrin repeat domain-containing protein [Aquisphaera insulae]|uniref:ankyrin repeat domain-containing protein n=1 Tax=Aquisphaera insulae TaxID=2712864 RepID=UPI0013EAE792|nr:ankyrin repeat domain-containing protein [Aquisphaera insulae]